MHSQRCMPKTIILSIHLRQNIGYQSEADTSKQSTDPVHAKDDLPPCERNFDRASVRNRPEACHEDRHANYCADVPTPAPADCVSEQAPEKQSRRVANRLSGTLQHQSPCSSSPWWEGLREDADGSRKAATRGHALQASEDN